MLEISGNIMQESLSEALETMAFMMAMPIEDDLPVPEQGTVVWMDFTGRVNGRVELLAGTEFIEMAAANIMGADPDDDLVKSKGVDAFKEILNTTCGVLLPKLADSPSDVFDVTVPESEDFSDSQRWTDYIGQNGVAVLDIDGFPLALRMTITS
ncbi:MAG: chemotaxis protein CheX [Sedimentisphaerales bacterium]|nr:chemotaxis protein CheX [Sedimentisphaerales bacterium]